MTAEASSAPTELEAAAALPVPSADELAGRFPLQPHPAPTSPADRAAALEELGFGVKFSDHMARAQYIEGQGWTNLEIAPYGPLSLDPAASVLHYGQEVFEGLKAYRRADGSVWAFRPAFNAHRLNASARRLALPELPVEDFLASIVDLVRADKDWVPTQEGATLYLRPFMFASEAFLGVRAAHGVTYLVIASPSGPYFKGGFSPVSIWVSRDYHRAGPGGTGAAKSGGNYAASLLPQNEAYAQGYQQVLFLDAKENRYVDELGGMNFFVVYEDGTLATPRLNGNILEGGTRGAIIKLLREEGTQVREEKLEFSTLLDDIRTGRIAEVFACGTAAVVTPVGKLGGEDFEVEVPTGELTKRIHDRITDIQWGRAEDTHGWCYRLA